MEDQNNMHNNNMPPGQPPMQQPPQQTPPVDPEPMGEAPKEKSSMGTWIGIVIVIIVLIIGGLYFWGAQLNKQAAELPPDEIAPLELETSNNASTEPTAIEADLEAFDVDAFEADLDAELEALEAELNNI